MQVEKDHIERCKTLIEAKIGWGDNRAWQSQDFENLSQKIFDVTKVMLSSSTLKRLWGKVKYESTPNRATLDALAQFLGFTGWLEFVNSNAGETTVSERVENTQPRWTGKLAWISALIGVGLVIFAISGLFHKSAKRLEFDQIDFTAHPVTFGLPNTVVFNYNAADSNADSVFIQQNWDARTRTRVEKSGSEFTSTYYFPGYFSAKLILNDSIVREQDLLIETDGWTAIIDQKPVPVYLSNTSFKDEMAIGLTQLKELGIDYTHELPRFAFFNVNKAWPVKGESLVFEAEIQNTYLENNGVCQKAFVLLMGTRGVILFPLCKTGCVGELALMIGMERVDGKTNDLSGFGVDFSEPVQIKCQTENQQIAYYVNGKKSYEHAINSEIGDIVGIQIGFDGTGRAANVSLK